MWRSKFPYLVLGMVWVPLACESPQTLRLELGELVVTPDRLDFGSIAAGAVAAQTLTLENTGTMPLDICLPFVSNEACPVASRIEPAGFVWPGRDMRWRLAPQEEAKVTVTFAPQTPQTFTGQLILGNNGRNGPQVNLALSGIATPPALTVSATEATFGATYAGQRRTQTLQITNADPLPLVVNATVEGQDFGMVGPDGAEVEADIPLDLELPAQTTVDIEVWFQPSVEGSFNGQLRLQPCDTCETTVSLAGLGVKPRFVIEPDRLDLGTGPVGDQLSGEFLVRVVGTSSVTVLGAAPDPDTPASFSTVFAGPVDLAPGASTAVEVRHVSTRPGLDLGHIQVRTNAWDDPATVEDESTVRLQVIAQADGPNIAVEPPSLDFGAVAPDDPPHERLVTIRNNGNLPLEVTDLRLSAGSPYTLSVPPIVEPLAPEDTLTFSVAYQPRGDNDDASLVISSSDLDESALVVPLTGRLGSAQGCALSVYPLPIDLGIVTRGRAANATARLYNRGDAPCTIQQLQLQGDTEFRRNQDPNQNLTIDAGTSVALPVTFLARDYGTYRATVSLDTDDPTQPSLSLPLIAEAVAGDTFVAPMTVDMAPVKNGCRTDETIITLANVDAPNMTVSAVRLHPASAPSFRLTAPLLPAGLDNQQALTARVVYEPTEPGAEAGWLLFESPDRTRPWIVPLFGTSLDDDRHTDRFTQENPPQVDVLFVVRNNGGMAAELDRLAQAFPFFLEAATSRSTDYHIAVTTMDMGGNRERGRFVNVAGEAIITPVSPDPAAAFTANVRTRGGGRFGGLASYFALSDPWSNEDNAGFLRPDADLHVIYVSDDEDDGAALATFYLPYFDDRPGAKTFVAHAIADDASNQCGADTPLGYIALVQATGGRVESICPADLTLAMTSLGEAVFGPRPRFPLSGQPEVSTFRVRVDNQTLDPTDWQYDPARNEIRFPSTTLPPPGASIEVRYDRACR